MPEEQWSTPTDLAGWDVRAVASHTAHLEGILAGAPEETAEVGEPPHVTGFMGLYTEIGVVNRREASPDSIINEIRSAVTERHTAMLADPPDGRVGAAVADLRRRALELADPAPQPPARHLDARAGHPPGHRPPRRDGHRRRRGTPPSTSRRASGSCSARR